MTEMLLLISVGLAGGVLGAVFFGGLWWTVRKGVSSRQPALLFFASLLLRTIIVLAGFYFVAGDQLARLLVCLLGFTVARFIVLHLTKSPGGRRNLPAKEANHAPES